ncbi:MAG: hypothetical protein F6J87_08550 [Spirulina sp. SIO3F2]|nr:hypothetical protein [Spirulina sp. SIO3F2]
MTPNPHPMNVTINAIATKSLQQFTVSETDYSTLTRLLNEASNLSEQDVTLAQRILYGVRHGIVSLAQ